MDARRNGSKLGSALGYCFRSSSSTEPAASAKLSRMPATPLKSPGQPLGCADLRARFFDRCPARSRPARGGGARPRRERHARDGPPLLPYLVLRQNRGRLRIASGDVEAGEADMRAAAGVFASSSFGPCLWPWRSSRAGAREAGRASEGTPARPRGGQTRRSIRRAACADLVAGRRSDRRWRAWDRIATGGGSGPG